MTAHPAPVADHGRLIIYSTDGKPNLWNSFGLRDFVTVGSRAYQIAGNSYFFLDLPAGTHRLTINKVKQTGFVRESAHYGDLPFTVTLASGETAYLELTKKGTSFSGTPVWDIRQVSQEAGAAAISPLPLSERFDTGLTVKER